MFVPASRLGGYALAVAAPLCWSIGGVVMRQVEAGPWEITFWRSFGHALVLAPVLLGFFGLSSFADFVRSGWVGPVVASLFASTFVLHVLAMSQTTVANVLVVQSVSPVMVAILAWLVLRERTPLRTWAGIAIALGGIATVLVGASGDGRLSGDLLALAVAACSAVNVILLRRHRSLDLLPVTILAGLIAAAVAGMVGAPLAIALHEVGVLAGLGIVQITLGLSCFIMALRFLPAVEVTLIALLEPVLGSLWAWLFVGEQPPVSTLIGGVAVLTAVGLGLSPARRGAPALRAPA